MMFAIRKSHRQYTALGFLVLWSACHPTQPQKQKEKAETGSIVEREVQFQNPNDGVVLYATLTLPADLSGLVPAAIFVHGSGPQDRNEVSTGSLFYFHPQVAFFEELAQAYAVAGVASLRYDKRTCIAANSQGRCPKEAFDWNIDNTTLEDFESDVYAAVEYLQQVQEIDGHNLVLVGHSQGANIVPQIAALDSRVSALVLIGPPAPLDPVATFFDQQRFMLRYLESLSPTEQRDSEIAQLQREIDEGEPLVAGIWEGTYSGDLLGLDAAFWLSGLTFKADMPANLAAAEQPIFAVAGELDFNTPADPYLANIRQWRGERAQDFYLTLPRANHMLVSPTEDPIATGIPGALLLTMASWVQVQTGTGHSVVDFTSQPSELEEARHALLCGFRQETCDHDQIDAFLTVEMKTATNAADLVQVFASVSAEHGVLVELETMLVDVFEQDGRLLLCQEDRVVFQDGTANILSTCWSDGPLLAGVFFG